MNRIDYIRQEEKKYHDLCYEQYKLFETGSWLYKPVKTVMDMMDYFERQNNLQVLDLGSGVGRNSIPIAQKIKNCSKDCYLCRFTSFCFNKVTSL